MDSQDDIIAESLALTGEDASYSAQEVALALAPKFFAFLSICGSSYIITDVIQTRQAFHSTHHRLLLGMSACNLVVSSLAFFMSTWPIPKEEDVYLASGNRGTCDVQGFFSQFSLSVVMYNASLSAYYCAKIRFQCKTKYIHNVLEPFFHVIPLTTGFGTAIAGLLLKLYNNNGWECWIAAWPQDCEESWTADDDDEFACIRGDNASIYRWVFYYGPLWLAILFVLVNMFWVYRTVYEQEVKMNKYNFEYQHALEEIKRQKLEKMLEKLEHELDDGNEGTALKRGGRMGSNNSLGAGSSDEDDGDDRDDVSVASSGSRMSKASSLASSGMRGALRGMKTISRQSFRIVQEVPKKLMRKKDELQRKTDALKAHFVQSRRVARQGYWFCGAFLATWMFPTIHSIVQLTLQKDVYGLQLLTAIFVPIQGLLNCVVYIQHRIRKEHIQRALCCELVKAGKKGIKSASQSFFQANSSHMPSSFELGSSGRDSRAPDDDEYNDEQSDEEEEELSQDGSETLRAPSFHTTSFAGLSSVSDDSSSSSGSFASEEHDDELPQLSRKKSSLIIVDMSNDDEDESEDLDATKKHCNNELSETNLSQQLFQSRRVRSSVQQIRSSLQIKSRLRPSLQVRESLQSQNRSSRTGIVSELSESSSSNRHEPKVHPLDVSVGGKLSHNQSCRTGMSMVSEMTDCSSSRLPDDKRKEVHPFEMSVGLIEDSSNDGADRLDISALDDSTMSADIEGSTETQQFHSSDRLNKRRLLEYEAAANPLLPESGDNASNVDNLEPLGTSVKRHERATGVEEHPEGSQHQEIG
ncbi:expressed unknown protein [Seminavis robusta]|uniref:G-protein coupled receptors family 2 profile 2 domain-containing protein n=1 Tax=Seminavis robusta TaxID=568900 RepID=A0A9N8DFB8_9STRA|nr:expressed unknown protein [Seminavis robusta]|eukprot:Sro65_g037020.1 n/a (809) ;mRNA; f:132836-135262